MPSSGQMANPTSVLDDLDSYLARLSEEEEDEGEEREEEKVLSYQRMTITLM